jgi:hypothetical protein
MTPALALQNGTDFTGRRIQSCPVPPALVVLEELLKERLLKMAARSGKLSA